MHYSPGWLSYIWKRSWFKPQWGPNQQLDPGITSRRVVDRKNLKRASQPFKNYFRHDYKCSPSFNTGLFTRTGHVNSSNVAHLMTHSTAFWSTPWSRQGPQPHTTKHKEILESHSHRQFGEDFSDKIIKHLIHLRWEWNKQDCVFWPIWSDHVTSSVNSKIVATVEFSSGDVSVKDVISRRSLFKKESMLHLLWPLSVFSSFPTTRSDSKNTPNTKNLLLPQFYNEKNCTFQALTHHLFRISQEKCSKGAISSFGKENASSSGIECFPVILLDALEETFYESRYPQDDYYGIKNAKENIDNSHTNGCDSVHKDATTNKMTNFRDKNSSGISWTLRWRHSCRQADDVKSLLIMQKAFSSIISLGISPRSLLLLLKCIACFEWSDPKMNAGIVVAFAEHFFSFTYLERLEGLRCLRRLSYAQKLHKREMGGDISETVTLNLFNSLTLTGQFFSCFVARYAPFLVSKVWSSLPEHLSFLSKRGYSLDLLDLLMMAMELNSGDIPDDLPNSSTSESYASKFFFFRYTLNLDGILIYKIIYQIIHAFPGSLLVMGPSPLATDSSPSMSDVGEMNLSPQSLPLTMGSSCPSEIKYNKDNNILSFLSDIIPISSLIGYNYRLLCLDVWFRVVYSILRHVLEPVSQGLSYYITIGFTEWGTTIESLENDSLSPEMLYYLTMWKRAISMLEWCAIFFPLCVASSDMYFCAMMHLLSNLASFVDQILRSCESICDMNNVNSKIIGKLAQSSIDILGNRLDSPGINSILSNPTELPLHRSSRVWVEFYVLYRVLQDFSHHLSIFRG